MAFVTFAFPEMAQTLDISPNCSSTQRSQFNDSKVLYKTVALIGNDDRIRRTVGEGLATSEIENAQVRIFCPRKGGKPVKNRSDINERASSLEMGNGTIALENDLAIVPRHMFINDDGSIKMEFKKCAIDHVSSGDVVAIADLEYKKDLNGDGPHASSYDFALIKLSSIPKDASAIPEDKILINPEIEKGAQLTVVSNGADNFDKNNYQARTITSCTLRSTLKSSAGEQYRFVGTDCDTGRGTSGASVFSVDTETRLFGLVTGEAAKVKPGSGYSAAKNSTLIVPFDESLLEFRDTLKSRTGI